MQLCNVRVTHYKSIEDSDEFRISPLTCLVGKNESGKSALLQAMYKLNPVESGQQFIPLDEFPRRYYNEFEEENNINDTKVLKTIWKFTDEDLVYLRNEFGIDVLVNSDIHIEIGYDNKRIYNFDFEESIIIQRYLQKYDIQKSEIEKCENLQVLKEALAELESPTENETQLLKFLTDAFIVNIKSSIENLLEKLLPKFVYFSEYHILPGPVAITDYINRKQQNNLTQPYRVFESLLSLARISVEEIQQIGKYEQLVAKLEAVSNRISREIFSYWSQNKDLRVDFRFDIARPHDLAPYNDGYIFRTRIYNNRHQVSVNFDERSTGFVWFFSFLVWFNQVRQIYGDKLVILLDEPGLNLHAKAQSDLLRFIKEKLCPHYQVIYTTHSPFMIDQDDILSVRTIEDATIDGNIVGTKVGDKVLSKDSDTIFPLQAALGYDVTQSLFVGKHTLLVEGPSDLLYIRWFSNELKIRGRNYLDPRWIISPAGGIDKISSFVALFGGNKLHVAVLTDFHQGERKKLTNLRESNLLREGHVFTVEMYVDQQEADIEDLMTRDFYIEIINRSYGLSGENAIPVIKPADAPDCVVKEAEKHFAILPVEIKEFDHYFPAYSLVNTPSGEFNELSGLDNALENFEKLFIDINALLLKKEIKEYYAG